MDAQANLSMGTELNCVPALVPFPVNIAMFRATRQRQDKAQPVENGAPLSRAATPYWRCCVAPCGRAGKRSPAALRRLARTRHSRRGVPCAQPLPDPLNMSILTGKGTSSLSDLGAAIIFADHFSGLFVAARRTCMLPEPIHVHYGDVQTSPGACPDRVNTHCPLHQASCMLCRRLQL